MSKSAFDVVMERYGVRSFTQENPVSAVADIADKVIARRNPNRLGLLVINMSTATVYLRPNGVASSTVGIVLSPSGGNASFDVVEDFMLPSAEWHAAASVDNSAIYVLELISEPVEAVA